MTLPGLSAPIRSSEFTPFFYITANQVDYNLFDAMGQPANPVDANIFIASGVVISASAGGNYPAGVHVPGVDAFTIDQFHVDSTFIIHNLGTIAGAGGEGGQGGHGNPSPTSVNAGGGGGAGLVFGAGGDAIPPATSNPGTQTTGGAVGTGGTAGAGSRANFPGGNGTHALVTGDYQVTIENAGGVIQGGGGGGFGGSGSGGFPQGVAGGDRGQDAPQLAGAPLTGYAGNAVLGSAVVINGGQVFGDNDNTPRWA